MKVDIARLRTQGYLTWPSLLAWVLFIVIVFQAWLLHLAADVFGITASIIRLVYVFTGFVGAALVFVSSFMLRGRRRLSAIVMAIALSITASVNVFQFIAYIIHIPRVNSVTEFSFLTAYLLGIIAVGAYFEWSLTWLGSLMGVVLDSVIAGYTVFIILSGWLPRTDIYGIWTPHLNGYITIDVAIFFALLVVVVRYGRRGGPGLVLGILAMVCLLMGDVAFTYSFYFSHTRTSLLAAPLYSLDIIKVRDILIGVFFHGVERCQSLITYCRTNDAYAPLPASIPPHSPTSCRILPWPWIATSTTRHWMATCAKAIGRSPTPTVPCPRRPIACSSA